MICSKMETVAVRAETNPSSVRLRAWLSNSMRANGVPVSMTPTSSSVYALVKCRSNSQAPWSSPAIGHGELLLFERRRGSASEAPRPMRMLGPPMRRLSVCDATDIPCDAAGPSQTRLRPKADPPRRSPPMLRIENRSRRGTAISAQGRPA